MADRVIYKGGQTVATNVGGNIQLIRPKRGSYHKFPVGGIRNLEPILSVQSSSQAG